MADDLDFSEEGDALDLQSFRDSQAAARARDDQTRFAETAQASAEQKPQEGGTGGPGAAALASDALSALAESPIGKVASAVKSTADWVVKLPKNLSLGVLDAAVSTAAMPFDVLKSMDETRQEIDGAAILRGDEEHDALPEFAKETPFQQKMRAMGTAQRVAGATGEAAEPAITELPKQFADAYAAWRESLREDDNLADSLTQGIAQFAVPFTAYSKAFGVAREVGYLGNAFRLAAADAVASATAFAPDSGRAADLVKLGLHAENKFGDTLRTLMPDGTLANQYIEWMTDHDGEGALGARFKNTLDGLGVSAVVGGVIKSAAMTFKAARKGIEIAAREKVVKSAVEPVGTGARETHTGLVFEKPEDAQAVVEELAHQFGPGFEGRHAAARNAASDKNFATLHSFASVLKANVDKPVKTHSLIEALEKNLKGDTEQGAFYKELLGRLKAKNLGGTTTVSGKVNAKGPRVVGKYNVSSNSIELNPLAFEAGPQRLLHTFTHEAVHKATVREMRESPQVSTQMERLRAQAEKALHAANEPEMAARRTGKPAGGLPHDLKTQDQYGFKNAEEFVAEIESNPVFRAEMKKVKIGDESAWDKYLKTIAGILGIAGLAANPEFDKLMDPKELEDESA